ERWNGCPGSPRPWERSSPGASGGIEPRLDGTTGGRIARHERENAPTRRHSRTNLDERRHDRTGDGSGPTDKIIARLRMQQRSQKYILENTWVEECDPGF